MSLRSNSDPEVYVRRRHRRRNIRGNRRGNRQGNSNPNDADDNTAVWGNIVDPDGDIVMREANHNDYMNIDTDEDGELSGFSEGRI